MSEFLAGHVSNSRMIGEGLPPRELWRIDLSIDGKIDMPVRDELNIIDVKKLVEIARELLYDPDYQWQSYRQDLHHLYFPAVDYGRNYDMIKHEFRGLSINKLRMPRELHNWIHYVFNLPKVPDRDAMIHRLETQRVVARLFRIAQRVGQTEASFEEYLDELLALNVEHYIRELHEYSPSIDVRFQQIISEEPEERSRVLERLKYELSNIAIQFHETESGILVPS